MIVNFNSPLDAFFKLGAFIQAGKRFAANRIGISAGIRTDMNTFTTNGMNGLQTLSPRISVSYVLADKWTWNSSAGIYYKIPPYTILGFAENNNVLVNKNARYQRSNHYTTGFEYLPNDGLRFTVEGFYKQYSHVPVSVRNGISLANLGTDFTLLGTKQLLLTVKVKRTVLSFLHKRNSQRISLAFCLILFTGVYIPAATENILPAAGITGICSALPGVINFHVTGSLV